MQETSDKIDVFKKQIKELEASNVDLAKKND